MVLSLWLVALIATVAIGVMAGSAYKGDFPLPRSESQKVQALLKDQFEREAAEQNTIVFHTLNGKKITDVDLHDRIDTAFTDIKGYPRVDFLASFYSEGNDDQINSDGTIAYATVQLKIPDSGTPVVDVQRIMDRANQLKSSDLEIEFGGQSIEDAIQPVPGISEGLGLIAAGVILFIIFGSLITMSLPLLTAVIALGVSLSIVGLLSHVLSLPVFAPTLAGLMGLGVGVDYALFIVNRHQKALINGRSIEESAVLALSTSGRAVLFAGFIVCIGLLGLVVLNISFIGGLAITAAIAVILTMFASVTFLPAMLGFVGIKALTRKQRVQLANGELREPDVKNSGWYRWAKTIERRPMIWMVSGLTVLLLLSVPFLSMRLGASDAGNDPGSSTTRKAYDLLVKGFGPGHNGPLLLVTKFSSPQDFNTFTNLLDRLGPTPGIQQVREPLTSPTGRAAVATVYPTTGPQTEETSDLINRLRNDVIPQVQKNTTLNILVGGETASYDDFGNVVKRKLPVFMGIVIGLSFVLLMFIFRSVVVPLKASLMNLLTAGASFGVVVAVFQWGWGGEQIGGGQGPIESFMPIMLFAILFGLSMDYEVFLVGRIKEEWIATNNNSEAVARGQAETGRLITAAGLIMVLIFASFVLGPDRIIKLFGVGLTAAIVLDVLVVRTVLVPAMMHLFGKWNWWLPEWLDRHLPPHS